MTEKRVPLFVDPWKRWKKTGKILLAVFAFYLLYVVIVDWAIPTWYWFRADYYIAKFQKEPSQKLADVLVYLLDRRLLPKAKGDKVLEMVTTPEVKVREAYPVGMKATAELSPRFEIKPWRSRPDMESLKVALSGMKYQDTTGSWYDSEGQLAKPNHVFHHYITIPIIDSSTSDISIQVSVIHRILPFENRTGWRYSIFGRFFEPRPIWQLVMSSTPSYQCSISVPIVFKGVVNMANPVRMISTPELDNKMMNALEFSQERINMSGQYDTRDSYTYEGPRLMFQYSNLPSHAAFRVRLRYDSDQPVLIDNKNDVSLGLYKGESGKADFAHELLACCNKVLEGTQTATLLLIPDRDVALQYPEMEAIWDSTLSYPIRYYYERTHVLR